MIITYKNAEISVRTEDFGNGTAIEVHVNGEKVLDLYNSQALCINERKALDRGFQFARAMIDSRSDSVSILTDGELPKKVINTPMSPGLHGKE